MQEICDSPKSQHIEDFFACWHAALFWPLTAEDEAANVAHRLSVLQMKVSLAQVFDRAVRGREFLKEVLRDPLDLGRPDPVQLLFERKVSRRTPNRFRNGIITHGSASSSHLEHKGCGVKQHFKASHPLRTETTFNDALNFGVGRNLQNFEYLPTRRQHTNGRLLERERVARDCRLFEAQLAELVLGRNIYVLTVKSRRVAFFLTELHAQRFGPGCTSWTTASKVTPHRSCEGPSPFSARQSSVSSKRLTLCLKLLTDSYIFQPYKTASGKRQFFPSGWSSTLSSFSRKPSNRAAGATVRKPVAESIVSFLGAVRTWVAMPVPVGSRHCTRGLGDRLVRLCDYEIIVTYEKISRRRKLRVKSAGGIETE